MFDLWRSGGASKKIGGEIPDDEILSFANIKKYTCGCGDVVYREVSINDKINLTLDAVFIDGLCNLDMFNKFVMKPIKDSEKIKDSKSESDFLKNAAEEIYHITAKESVTLKETINEILNGAVAIVADSEGKALIFEVKGFAVRAMSEPSNESVIKGPKNSFIESVRANTAQVRRFIRSTDLRMESLEVGNVSKIPVSLIYMDTLKDEKILSYVREKINSMRIDGIFSIGEFEELLYEQKFSLFPKVLVTERPDRFCSNVMDGKIGVIVDGFPTAIILPAVFGMFFQSADDYANNWAMATFVRLMRYLCTFIAIFLPAVYISVVSFHQELLNNMVALSIIKSKGEVPLSSLQEVLFLMLAFEVLLEAGIRMPKTIGQTVPIIGGLIVGDAAVSAKLLSPTVVIVAAITGIAGFMIPNQDLLNSMRIFRYFFIFCSMFAGFFGLSAGIAVFIYCICSEESFSVPYFVPFAANEGKNLLLDTLVRLPKNINKN